MQKPPAAEYEAIWEYATIEPAGTRRAERQDSKKRHHWFCEYKELEQKELFDILFLATVKTASVSRRTAKRSTGMQVLILEEQEQLCYFELSHVANELL